MNLNEVRAKKKREKEARLAKKNAEKVWFDQTPKVGLPDRCMKQKLILRGPMVLSKNKGTVIMAFGLSMTGLHRVAIEADCKEKGILEGGDEDSISKSEEGDNVKKKRGQGDAQRSTKFQLTPDQIANAGRWADEKYGQRKSYCESLPEMHNREDRAEELQEQTLRARRKLTESYRASFRKLRTVELQVFCSAKFNHNVGNYLAWYDDEFLLAEYYGETFEGIPHGRGYKYYSSGASYMGDWVHGLETTTKPGTFGIFEWPDGTKYEGTYQRGKRHGRGTKTLPLQRGSYEGEFANNIEHGLGCKRYADGSFYEGRFRYGVRDGSGCMHNIDGTKEKGVFRDPPLGDEQTNDSAIDPPRASLTDYETPDLLSLCTKRLAQVIAESPGLYSASLLQRVLPPERKPLVAAMFVDALEESGGESLSHNFAKLVPIIAWSDQRFMDLSGTRLTKRDVALFVYFLETNHVIEDIQISSCGVDASAIGLFGRIIRNCPRMHLINFSWNNLGKAGASALAQALSTKGCNLKTLVLGGCQLGPSGAESLAEMLKKNTTLKHLRIPYNAIGPLGAVAFAHVIPHNKSLNELDLRGNNIGASGGISLAAALLKNCGSLKVVNMSDNRLGEAAAASVGASLKGSVLDGLRSFGSDHLIGPTSVTGTLQEKRRLYREKKLSERKAKEDEAREAAEIEASKPPAVPKFNMLHNAL